MLYVCTNEWVVCNTMIQNCLLLKIICACLGSLGNHGTCSHRPHMQYFPPISRLPVCCRLPPVYPSLSPVYPSLSPVYPPTLVYLTHSLPRLIIFRVIFLFTFSDDLTVPDSLPGLIIFRAVFLFTLFWGFDRSRSTYFFFWWSDRLRFTSGPYYFSGRLLVYSFLRIWPFPGRAFVSCISIFDTDK